MLIDVEALLDRPAQAAEQHRAAARVAGAEHADAVELALGRERADDAGARGAVAAEVALVVVARRDRRPRRRSVTATALSTSPTSGWPASTPLSRMQTRTPLPVAPPSAQSRVTRSGHVDGDRDPVACAGGQAPRRKVGKVGSVGCGLLLRHPRIVRGG